MTFKTVLMLILFVLFINSCTTKESVKEIKETVTYKADTVFIDNKYPEIKSKFVLEFMDKLKVCTCLDTISELPPCTNEFFRVFNYKTEFNLEKGFLIEMKAGLFGSPVKQLLVVNQNLKYEIVNRFYGFLLEQRTSETGFNDLLMGYQVKDIGVVAVKHVWNGKKYDPIDVEEINGSFVKTELKDSINKMMLGVFED